MQFYGVLILGDFFDCYAVSQHRKDPRRTRLIAWELGEARKLVRDLDACGFEQKIFIEGNHEWRFDRYLQDFAPALVGLHDKRELFGLTKSWKYVPYMDDEQVGKINATHDLGKAGDGALKDAMASYMDNVVIGHTHLFEMRVRGNARGIPHVGASFGWLGDIKKIDYKHQVKAKRDYVLGFGVGHERGNGVMYVEPVPIVQYTCCVEGRLFY